MNFTIITLGCKVNQFESQSLESSLILSGGTAVDPTYGFDVGVVNTCAVTGESGRKSRAALRRLRRHAPSGVIVATGCFAQISPQEAQSLGADIICGTGNRAQLAKIILKTVSQGRPAEPIILTQNVTDYKEFEHLSAGLSDSRTRALLKIQDGCDNFCTYCIIPHARGRVRSLDPQSAGREASRLADLGYREIVVTGIEISSYGMDLPDTSLIDALRQISKNAPDLRLRLGSLDPAAVSDEFTANLKTIPNLCEHFHISLQSGCTDTLRRMGRKYNTDTALRALDAVRKHFPCCGLSADFITGFPGETDLEFSQTLEFVKQAKLSKAHIFPYSERPGTPAAVMPGNVSKALRIERAKQLRTLSEISESEFIKSLSGKMVEVLIETSNGTTAKGYSREYVEFTINKPLPKNTIYSFRA